MDIYETGLGREWGHLVQCALMCHLSISILLLDSHWLGLKMELTVRSSSITHLCGVGAEGLGISEVYLPECTSHGKGL